MSRVIAAFTQFFDGTGAPLENGWLEFLYSNTTSSQKATYTDSSQSIPNANPLQLDAEGRCPSVFGQGVYRVNLYENNSVLGAPGTLIQSFDPVLAEYASEGAGGNFAEWSSETVYQVGQIVIYNELYYRSHTANNIGNQPDISLDSWERIDFLRFYNIDVTYGLDDIVIYNSNLYFSLVSGNLNNQPDISPSEWDPVGSGTILLNWQESGTDFIPKVDGYNIGDATHRPGTVYIIDAPTADDHGANKAYVDGRGTGLTNWEDASDLRPLTDDNDDLGDATHRAANVWIANDPTDPDHAAKKSYVDAFDHITDWEDTGTTLRPKADDSEDLGDSTHRPSNIWIANDATNDDHAVRKSQLDSALAAVQGFKNQLINGNFDIWQRNDTTVSPQTSSGYGSDDRWSNDHLVSTKTHSRQTFTPGQTDVPGNPKYYSRTVVTSGSAVNSYVIKGQKLESVIKLSGKTVTVSFWAKADSSKNIASEFVQLFGTGGSPSSAVSQIGVTSYSLTTSWQKFTATVDIPSVSGKTVGSNNDDSLNFRFWFEAGSNYNSNTNSLGNQSGTFDIAQVQIEEGSVATAFESMSFEDQLLRCLPYYQKTYNYETTPGTTTTIGRIVSYTTGFSFNAYTMYLSWLLKQPMAFTPSVVIYDPDNGSSGYVRMESGSIAISGVDVSKNIITPYATDSTASTTRYMAFHATADAEL